MIRAFTCAFLIYCFNPFWVQTAKGADILDEVTGYLRTGNSKEIAKYLVQNVEMAILLEEDIYSKAQAELILKDFFAKHPPTSVKVLHKLTSNSMHRFTVLLLSTSNGTFRASYSMKNFNGKFLITEIRIESNKN